MIMYKLTVSCILLTILFVDVSQAKSHLKDCVYGNECDGNLNCFPDPRNPNSTAKKCRCNFGQIYLPARKSCQPMESTACQNDTQCQDRDVNRNCNQTSNLCQCSGNQTPDQVTGRCLGQRLSQCRVDDDCPSNLECYHRTRTCLCTVNHVWNQSKSECLLMSQPNALCASESDCQDRDRNRICSNTTIRDKNKLCVCRLGYFYHRYYNNFCTKQKSFGESCPSASSLECDDDFLGCYRVNRDYQCRCVGDRIWSAKQSKCLSVSEFRCQNNDECQTSDQNRACNATKHCDCRPGFYYHSYYKQCFEKTKLGKTCEFNVQCASNNSMCHKTNSWSSLGDCTCQPSHRRSNQVCLQRKCRDDYECGSPSFDEDKNFVCTNGKCGCRQGYEMDLKKGTGKCLKQSDGKGSTVKPSTRKTQETNEI